MNKCKYCGKKGTKEISINGKLRTVCDSAFCIDAAGVDDFNSRNTT